MRVEEAVYQVSFYGNANTSLEKVKDFALMRAAELGLNMGYTYFTVVGEENRTEWSETKVLTQNDNSHNENHGGILIGGRPLFHADEYHYETRTSFEPGIMFLVTYFEEYPTGEGLQNPVLECAATFQKLQFDYEIQEQ